MEHSLVKIEAAVLLLLLIASLGAVFFKRVKLPFTVGLVMVGLALGLLEPWLMPFQSLAISHDLIIFLFVPPLIFASASNIDSRLFFRTLTPILILAGPGLVVSLMIVGVCLAWLTPLNLGSALLFGALISATDPVAVVALFETLGVPARLKILVDGESMLNDATAIVAFTAVLGIIASGNFQAATLGHALVNVILALLGGALVGVLISIPMRFTITAAGTNPLIQFAVTLVIAYFAFLIADSLKASGVVAVLSAGLVIGRYKADLLKTEVKARLDDLWELTAALANSLIFLLVGLTAARFFIGPQVNHSFSFWTAIIWAIVAAIVARGVMIFAITPCMNPFLKQGPIDLRNQLVSFWGGLRGAVALALALSLANDFPQRELLLAMTLGVALFTILVGGLTTGPLIRRFKLDTPEPVVRLAEAQARFLAQQRSLERLGELRVWEPVFPAAFAGSENYWAAGLEKASAHLVQTWEGLATPEDLTRQAVWRQALHMEKLRYQEAHDQNLLSPKTFDWLKLMLNLKDDAISAGQIPPPALASEALETPLEKGVAKMLGLVRCGKGVGQRHTDRALQQRYEFNLVVAVISKRVGEEIRRLSQELTGQLDPAIFEACAVWYAATSQDMFQLLKAQEDEHPQIFQAIQQHVVRQAVQASARERLAQLLTYGIVSSAIAEKLEEEFESKASG
jgi:monovalent cation:H+ antiporter, CPA1 family